MHPRPAAELHLEGDFKKTRLKLTWLAASADAPALELAYFGYLLTKRKLEEDDDFEQFVNRDSVGGRGEIGFAAGWGWAGLC